MPELPEVETVLRDIYKSGIVNSSFSKIEVKKAFHIKNINVDDFTSKLVGETIHKLERKGKWLFFFLDN